MQRFWKLKGRVKRPGSLLGNICAICCWIEVCGLSGMKQAQPMCVCVWGGFWPLSFSSLQSLTLFIYETGFNFVQRHSRYQSATHKEWTKDPSKIIPGAWACWLLCNSSQCLLHILGGQCNSPLRTSKKRNTYLHTGTSQCSGQQLR